MKMRNRLLFVAVVCGLSFYAGLSVRKEPKTLIKHVYITEKVPMFLPYSGMGYSKKDRALIEAAIDARTLKGGKDAR